MDPASHSLTIDRLAVRPALVPLSHPVRTASGDVTHAPLVLIDLHTREGVTGRSYLFTYTPLVLKSTVELLGGLETLLQGQECNPRSLKLALDSRFRLLGTPGLLAMALAGIDMAAWDALARATGLPLARLLGASLRSVPSYFSQGMDGKARGVELAKESLRRGFKAMKIKIGYPTLEEDVSVVKAVQDALGSSSVLMVDYNQSLSVPEAIRRCRALDELQLAWIEEPVQQDDYVGHARVASEVQTPIQMGENWFGVRELSKCTDVGGCDLAMLDVMKIGGVSGWLSAAETAAARSLPVSSHIFQEVSAHLLAATPTCHWLEYLDIADRILRNPLEVTAGGAVISDQPGSGVEWNSKAVERYVIR